MDSFRLGILETKSAMPLPTFFTAELTLPAIYLSHFLFDLRMSHLSLTSEVRTGKSIIGKTSLLDISIIKRRRLNPFSHSGSYAVLLNVHVLKSDFEQVWVVLFKLLVL